MAGYDPPPLTNWLNQMMRRLSELRLSTFLSQPFFNVFSCVGEPSAPKLEARFHNRGNSFKVNWIKQDDGGLPIKHYLVRYKAVSTTRPTLQWTYQQSVCIKPV